MSYSLLTILSFIFLISISYFFYLRGSKNRKGSDARVEKDGGSAIFSKSLMNYGVWLLKPFAHFLVLLKLTPNHITFISMFLAIVAAFPIAQGNFLLGGILFSVSSLFDALDGMMCRELGTCSEAGSILDSTADRVGELFLYFGLVFFFRDNIAGMLGTFSTILGAVLVSYISAKGEIFKMKNLPRGIMRRGERALYINLGLILSPLLAYHFENSFSYSNVMILILWTVGILANYSSLRRFYWLYQTLKNRK